MVRIMALPKSKRHSIEYVAPDGTKTYSAISAERIAKKMANDLGRMVQIHWHNTATDKYGSHSVKATRKKNPTVPTSSLPIGTWEPAHAIRQNADGTIDILREKNSGRRANISEGFMAGGVFHPIRAAGDYDASRAGEARKYKKKRKKSARPTATGRQWVAKKASTKKAMPISRREYGGDGSRYRNPGTLPTSKKNDVEYVMPDGALSLIHI